jgi:hypothetical protein
MATQSAPFVPRDVFRLLVRLEAQKTHDVDSATLERRFRVPAGYAKDETLDQRERKAQTVRHTFLHSVATQNTHIPRVAIRSLQAQVRTRRPSAGLAPNTTLTDRVRRPRSPRVRRAIRFNLNRS